MVAFLITRVKNSDEDDWGKLKRVLKYLNGTKCTKLKLSVDSLPMLKWHINRSHNVHADCRGHGEALFTMGKGATSSYLRKLKLNAWKLTESELITANMYMPEMLWLQHFIQAQGYRAEWIGLYQDNISTQLLIKNGLVLSRKKTKHIKAKFFFIKDRVDEGEIRVMDCLGEEMWAYVLTKPFQGMAFQTMRAELMNCPVNYEDPLEKKVGEDVKETTRWKMGRSIYTSLKTVTWKSVIATSYKTLQECVGHSGARIRKIPVDRPMVRRIGRTTCSQGHVRLGN